MTVLDDSTFSTLGTLKNGLSSGGRRFELLISARPLSWYRDPIMLCFMPKPFSAYQTASHIYSQRLRMCIESYLASSRIDAKAVGTTASMMWARPLFRGWWCLMTIGSSGSDISKTTWVSSILQDRTRPFSRKKCLFVLIIVFDHGKKIHESLTRDAHNHAMHGFEFSWGRAFFDA